MNFGVVKIHETCWMIGIKGLPNHIGDKYCSDTLGIKIDEYRRMLIEEYGGIGGGTVHLEVKFLNESLARRALEEYIMPRAVMIMLTN